MQDGLNCASIVIDSHYALPVPKLCHDNVPVPVTKASSFLLSMDHACFYQLIRVRDLIKRLFIRCRATLIVPVAKRFMHLYKIGLFRKEIIAAVSSLTYQIIESPFSFNMLT